jgi:hypothetical protein
MVELVTLFEPGEGIKKRALSIYCRHQSSQPEDCQPLQELKHESPIFVV